MSSVVIMGMKLIRISKTNSYQLEISDNAGISWQLQYEGCFELGDFYYLGQSGTILFAKTASGKFKSFNLGKSWEVWR